MARHVTPPQVRARTDRPRRGRQLLVWALTLVVFSGLALLSGERPGTGIGSDSPTGALAMADSRAAPAAASGVPASPLAAPEEEAILALPPLVGDVGSGPATDCVKYDEVRNSLPLNRWTSFGLSTTDDAKIFKIRTFMTMIAGFLFMVASLIWRLIGVLMGLGFTFDMVCATAGPINSAARVFSNFAGWFLIPAWLFVLAAAVKRWTGGGHKGPASAVRMIMVFLAATGLIFFIGEQSDEHQNQPTAAYTVPWMASTVQGWFGDISAALPSLMKVGEGTSENPVFYDFDPKAAGGVTCAALDNTLYDAYATDNLGTNIKNGVGAMTQVSKIWEISLVRSWITAQFGDGTKEFPSPAHAACRALEASSGLSEEDIMASYDRSTGNTPGTTTVFTKRGRNLSPFISRLLWIHWGACKGSDDGRSGAGPTPQWADATKIEEKEKACQTLYSGAVATTDYTSNVFLGKEGLAAFRFDDDEVYKKLGDCFGAKSCRYDIDFVTSIFGDNQSERIVQSLMALIVAVVFLFVLGPMALGLMLISIALAALAMILPVSLLLAASRIEQGKKLLKLTGAAAAGKFIFTLALTALATLIQVTTFAITDAIGTETPNFFEQVAQAAAPLAALLLFKKLSRTLGLGNISGMTGALGFAGAAALKATGDRDLSRGAAERLSGAIGRVGFGNKRLSTLDERTLQRRMVGSLGRSSHALLRGTKRTRASGQKGGLEGMVAPVTDFIGHAGSHGRGFAQRRRNDLARLIGPGSRGRYAAGVIAAGYIGGAITPLAAAAPLIPFLMRRIAQKRRTGHFMGKPPGPEGGGEGFTEGSAAGIPMTDNHRAAKTQFDRYRRAQNRINDEEERDELAKNHVKDGLTAHTARLWGAGHRAGNNEKFGGFETPEQMDKAVEEMALKIGVDPSSIEAAMNGLATVFLAETDPRTGRKIWHPDTTVEQAGNPVSYLEPHELKRKMIEGVPESNETYLPRVFGMLRERGYLTDNGDLVNALDAHGFDTHDPMMRARILAWVRGGRDDELDAIRITARHSETAGLGGADEWGAARTPAAPPSPPSPPGPPDWGSAPPGSAGGWQQVTVMTADGTPVQVMVPPPAAQFGSSAAPPGAWSTAHEPAPEQFGSAGALMSMDEAVRDEVRRAFSDISDLSGMRVTDQAGSSVTVADVLSRLDVSFNRLKEIFDGFELALKTAAPMRPENGGDRVEPVLESRAVTKRIYNDLRSILDALDRSENSRNICELDAAQIAAALDSTDLVKLAQKLAADSDDRGAARTEAVERYIGALSNVSADPRELALALHGLQTYVKSLVLDNEHLSANVVNELKALRKANRGVGNAGPYDPRDPGSTMNRTIPL